MFGPLTFVLHRRRPGKVTPPPVPRLSALVSFLTRKEICHVLLEEKFGEIFRRTVARLEHNHSWVRDRNDFLLFLGSSLSSGSGVSGMAFLLRSFTQDYGRKTPIT